MIAREINTPKYRVTLMKMDESLHEFGLKRAVHITLKLPTLDGLAGEQTLTVVQGDQSFRELMRDARKKAAQKLVDIQRLAMTYLEIDPELVAGSPALHTEQDAQAVPEQETTEPARLTPRQRQQKKMRQSHQHNVTAHRLGVAKAALKRMARYYGDQWESDSDVACSLRCDADSALREIERIGKKDTK